MDLRQDQLKSWAKSQLEPYQSSQQNVSADQYQWFTVSGDASFRRYFRIKIGQTSYIAVDAPVEHEDSRPFIDITTAWKAQGVNTPNVIAEDMALGFMLLEDFGDDLCLIGLNSENVDVRYQASLDELARIQCLDMPSLPLYSAELLERELDLFPQWFLNELLGITPNSQQATEYLKVKQCLIQSALEQPQVVVHRDYHSRNLLLITPQDAETHSHHKIGVIDFQDAVIGPVTYDLVSLLRDCYIRWPNEQVLGWLNQYANTARNGDYGRLNQCFDKVSEDQLIRWFELMGVQRHVKVLGIFARLAIRDGKPAYLDDIPRVLAYVVDACSRYPELSSFAVWLASSILPVLIKHKDFQAHTELLRELQASLGEQYL